MVHAPAEIIKHPEMPSTGEAVPHLTHLTRLHYRPGIRHIRGMDKMEFWRFLLKIGCRYLDSSSFTKDNMNITKDVERWLMPLTLVELHL